MTLHIDPTPPTLTQDQALNGWRREFCIELLGDGEARLFVRLVDTPSLHARELQQGVLFHRIGAGFTDLQSCVAAAAEPLRQLVRTAQRQQPCRSNLFAAVTFDRRAWDAVMDAVDRWQRRPHAAARCTLSAAPVLRPPQRQESMLSRRVSVLNAARALRANAGVGREA